MLPFDVPVEIRSRNTIISYAYEKSFIKTPEMVKPDEIVQAVKKMMSGEVSIEQTKAVML